MDIFQIDEDGLLYISPDIDDWAPVILNRINVIIDLDGDLDIGVPFMPNELVYVYFPFDDDDLPDLDKLHEIAKLGSNLVTLGYRVLAHCKMGHNRSALMAGVILTYLGLTGEEATQLLRQKLLITLYNPIYATYLRSLPRYSGR